MLSEIKSSSSMSLSATDDNRYIGNFSRPFPNGINNGSAASSTSSITRNLTRCITRIESFLPSSNALVSEQNSPEFYREQMNEAREFMKKLTTMSEREDLSDAHFTEINRCLTRLRDYLATLDRILMAKANDSAATFNKEFAQFKQQQQQSPQAAGVPPAHPGPYLNDCIPKYDGNVLRWPMFWATYQDVVGTNSRLSERSKFRILYHNLDAYMKTKLSDIDPLKPNMKQVNAKIHAHFTDEENIRYGIEKTLLQIAVLKDGYNNEHWYALADSAKLTKVFITGRLQESWDKYFANFFIRKLSPKHYHRFLDKLAKEKKKEGSLADFTDFCLWSVRLNERMSNNGMLPFGKVVSEELCLLCQQDYHFPQDCDVYFTVDDRKKIVRERRLCRRCLLVEYSRGHDCGQRCVQCFRPDHHVALCVPSQQQQFEPNNSLLGSGPALG